MMNQPVQNNVDVDGWMKSKRVPGIGAAMEEEEDFEICLCHQRQHKHAHIDNTSDR